MGIQRGRKKSCHLKFHVSGNRTDTGKKLIYERAFFVNGNPKNRSVGDDISDCFFLP